MSLVVVRLGSGLVAASPVGPAEPVGRVVCGPDSEHGEQVDVCRPSAQIGSRVRLALTRVSGMYAEDLTRAGVQKALDPTGLRFFDVKNVVREGDTMTISVLVLSSDAEVDQCYHFIRPVQGGDNQGSATPASSC
ncbi:hypothetical protein ABZ763_04480 [Streptomyces bacillaris]|uniref:hypothetical protein n=1 Tax=Streptomyces bacillaris TaxID=68179 RepID=UPI003460D54C